MWNVVFKIFLEELSNPELVFLSKKFGRKHLRRTFESINVDFFRKKIQKNIWIQKSEFLSVFKKNKSEELSNPEMLIF